MKQLVTILLLAIFGYSFGQSLTANISGGGTSCDDGFSTDDLGIYFNGGEGPWHIDIMLDGLLYETLTVVQSPYTLPVAEQGCYTLANLTDNQGTIGEVSGTACVVLLEEVQASFRTECNNGATAGFIGGVVLADHEYQIVVEVTQGDLNSIVMYMTPYIGSFTETASGSGIWFSDAIPEITNIEINITDGSSCNELIISNVNTVCSCPVQIDAFYLTDQAICTEQTTTLTVEYKGEPDSYYNVIVTQPDYTIIDDLQNRTGTSIFTIHQEGEYMVKVENLFYDCEERGPSLNLIVNPLATAVIQTVCNNELPRGGVSLEKDEFQLVAEVTQGDLTSIEITEKTSHGVTFTRDGTSQYWYSRAIDETNTVDVHVTDDNDCNGGIHHIGLTTQCDIVSGGLSSSEETGMTIYPNPTHDKFSIRLTNESKNSELIIFDILGNKVSQQTISASLSEVPVSHLETGIYIIEVTQGHNKFIERIVIK
jgi:hypothetical protein